MTEETREDEKYKDDSIDTLSDLITSLLDSLTKVTERNVELLTYLHGTGRHKGPDVCPERSSK